jgi:hypothetical protein
MDSSASLQEQVAVSCEYGNGPGVTVGQVANTLRHQICNIKVHRDIEISLFSKKQPNKIITRRSEIQLVIKNVNKMLSVVVKTRSVLSFPAVVTTMVFWTFHTVHYRHPTSRVPEPKKMRTY